MPAGVGAAPCYRRSMGVEWTVIRTGIATLVVQAGLFAWLRRDLGNLAKRVDAMADQVRQLGERTAKVERLLEGLRPTPSPGPAD